MSDVKPPREKSAGAGPNQERRRGDRLRSHTLADGEVRDAQGRTSSFLGSTIDLSLGGAQVRTYEALETGTRVVLHLRLPEGDVATTGTVMHVKIDPIGCRLAGIRFDDLLADSAELLAAHLQAFGLRVPGAAATDAHAVATEVPVTGRIEPRGAKR